MSDWCWRSSPRISPISAWLLIIQFANTLNNRLISVCLFETLYILKLHTNTARARSVMLIVVIHCKFVDESFAFIVSDFVVFRYAVPRTVWFGYGFVIPYALVPIPAPFASTMIAHIFLQPEVCVTRYKSVFCWQLVLKLLGNTANQFCLCSMK